MPVSTHSFLTLFLVSVLTLGLSAFPSRTFAQIDFRIGVEAGVSAMTDGGLEAETNRRVGFTAGGFGVIGFEGPVALRPHLLYVQKGYVLDAGEAEIRDPDGNPVVEPAEMTARRDYIELQLPAEVRNEFGRDLTARLFGGLTLGFNVNSEVEHAGSGLDNKMVNQEDTTSDYETGLLFGAGEVRPKSWTGDPTKSEVGTQDV